jgi:hypothetical protein
MRYSLLKKFYFFALIFVTLNTCKSRRSGKQSQIKSVKKITYTFDSYLNACASSFGISKAQFPKIDCTKGSQVITTSRGKHINYEAFEINSKCENPSLSVNPDDACRPHSWVGQFVDKGIRWSYFCGQSSETGKNEPKADSIKVIGYREDTGATCFFETKEDAVVGVNLKQIPSFQTDLAKQYWKNPNQMANEDGSDCVSCHSGNPWIRSSHLNILTKGTKEQFVPKNTSSRSSVQIPYWVVADKNLQSLNKNRSWTPKRLETSSAPNCTMCHSIGNNFGCSINASLNMGVLNTRWHAFENTNFDKLFTHQKAFGNRVNSLETFKQSVYLKELQNVLECCDAEKLGAPNKKCRWKSLSKIISE